MFSLLLDLLFGFWKRRRFQTAVRNMSKCGIDLCRATSLLMMTTSANREALIDEWSCAKTSENIPDTVRMVHQDR